MAHYAYLDENNVVTQVIVGKNENETWQGQPMNWEEYYGAKRTSYNTHRGIYFDANGNPSPDQTKAFRKNFAGVGFTYDSVRDAFIPPKPFPSWTLNEQTCIWDAPVPYPNDGQIYMWDEATQSWVEIQQ